LKKTYYRKITAAT